MTNLELKQIRHSMNLTQSELAKILHVHVRTMSRWECGEWKIPEDKAELLEYKWRDFNTKSIEYSDNFMKVWARV